MKYIPAMAALLCLAGSTHAADPSPQPPQQQHANSVAGVSGPILFSRDSVPWAVKTYNNGFVRQEDVRWESCELYDYRVVIKRQYGKIRTGQVVHLDTRGSYAVLSKQAYAEEVTEGGPAPCDVPATRVTVTRWLPEAGPQPFTIYSSAGCGSTPMQRTGPASRTFMDILGHYCPLTVPLFKAGD